MIYYRNEVRGTGLDGKAIKATAQRLLEAVDERTSSLSVTLVNDETIRTLNAEHRGKDVPTDVLSFPLEGPSACAREQQPEHMIGDVVISVDTARRQAADYDATLQVEVYRLLVHGLLHVMGHDHEEATERRIMESEEQRLAAAIGMIWPY
jgi:probable rRNA maturation factor